MKIKLSKNQWKEIGMEQGWITAGKFELPDDYKAIREMRFKEHDEKNSSSLGVEENEDAIVSRRRTIKVELSDGNHIITDINGTKKEIEDYYLDNEDRYQPHGPQPVKVKFLG